MLHFFFQFWRPQDAHGVTPLALCVLNGKHESVACVPVLIAHGANPNQTDSDESESGHQSVSAKGKSKSESVQSVHHLGHHQSLLHTLASTDRVEMARVLLKEGARLDTTNLEGQTRMRLFSIFFCHGIISVFQYVRYRLLLSVLFGSFAHRGR
jgi:hypothetical protein